MAQIPGLPANLIEVPPAPVSPDDPEAGAKRAAWLAWRADVCRHRITVRHDLQDDPGLRPFELKRCAADPAYFAAAWLSIFEPRQRAAGTGTFPFVPFAAQVDVIRQLLASLVATDESADVVWSKCRGWGATWLFAELGLWGWLFSDLWDQPQPWNILYISRKWEFVDSSMQKSIFYKIRRLLRDVPEWMMPAGFIADLHDHKGILKNPANDNELSGESTNTNAGRGDRVTAAVIDEGAAIEDFEAIWSTLAETTDHRWAVSTESIAQGDGFYRLRRGDDDGNRPFLIESDWWQNPLNTDAWLENQKIRYKLNPDAFQIEILRNPLAGQTAWVYPKAWELSPDPAIRPIVGRQSYVTVDPGFADETAIVAAQENERNGIDILDSYANLRKPADFYAPLLKPALFDTQTPDWRDAISVTWISPLPNTDQTLFHYDEEELRFARTVDAMGGTPTFVGDTYGDNVTGATADSVYDRWGRFGVHVNRDRLGNKDLSAYRAQARTFKGRREALSERLSSWRFAETPGAIRTLNALKNNRFKAQDRPTMSEAKTPLHDDSSHHTSACEFLACHLRNRGAILARAYSKPIKSTLGAWKGSPAWSPR